jgi:hypothetical protein
MFCQRLSWTVRLLLARAPADQGNGFSIDGPFNLPYTLFTAGRSLRQGKDRAMDSIGGFSSALGEAFRGLLQTILGALTGFSDRIVGLTNRLYSVIPKEYVLAGGTILVLGILLMVTMGRMGRR